MLYSGFEYSFYNKYSCSLHTKILRIIKMNKTELKEFKARFEREYGGCQIVFYNHINEFVEYCTFDKWVRSNDKQLVFIDNDRVSHVVSLDQFNKNVVAKWCLVEGCRKPDDETESQIEQARGEQYGDFKLNMIALTRIIESMATQATQSNIKLPNNFGALVMCQAKVLRECFKHKEDNGLDHFNYLKISREIVDNE